MYLYRADTITEKEYYENIVDNIDQVAEISVESNTVSLLKAADLMKLINQLPKGYKTVFNLFVIEGFHHDEISKMLNEL